MRQSLRHWPMISGEPMVKNVRPECITLEVASIATMSRDELHDLWRRLHRKPPPKGLVGDLLRRALAWRLQCLQYCIGETELWKRVAREARAAERRLAMAERTTANEALSAASSRRTLRAGTRLLREWKGVMHEVVVLPNGFLWNGEVYRSLSVIARAIAGTTWNGWLFFGLNTPRANATAEPASTRVEPRRDAIRQAHPMQESAHA